MSRVIEQDDTSQWIEVYKKAPNNEKRMLWKDIHLQQIKSHLIDHEWIGTTRTDREKSVLKGLYAIAGCELREHEDDDNGSTDSNVRSMRKKLGDKAYQIGFELKKSGRAVQTQGAKSDCWKFLSEEEYLTAMLEKTLEGVKKLDEEECEKVQRIVRGILMG
ncbi:MAG: hypothetical protein M1813_002188 [Trichoglossum hirsutum]|nr:MAG: hypothetical protein M1813_002188 [Trichoglossum hirsutum]